MQKSVASELPEEWPEAVAECIGLQASGEKASAVASENATNGNKIG